MGFFSGRKMTFEEMLKKELLGSYDKKFTRRDNLEDGVVAVSRLLADAKTSHLFDAVVRSRESETVKRYLVNAGYDKTGTKFDVVAAVYKRERKL